jgi:hypothetical protein
VVVLDGLESVRESEETPMSDRVRVQYIATRLGYPEATSWLEAHQQEYFEGLSRGFMADE